MKTITIDLATVNSQQDLHAAFKEKMGFPDFYGMNWDAWLDCMSDIGEVAERSMTSNILLKKNEELTIILEGAAEFSEQFPELMKHLVEVTASANRRYLNSGENKWINLRFISNI